MNGGTRPSFARWPESCARQVPAKVRGIDAIGPVSVRSQTVGGFAKTGVLIDYRRPTQRHAQMSRRFQIQNRLRTYVARDIFVRSAHSPGSFCTCCSAIEGSGEDSQISFKLDYIWILLLAIGKFKRNRQKR